MGVFFWEYCRKFYQYTNLLDGWVLCEIIEKGHYLHSLSYKMSGAQSQKNSKTFFTLWFAQEE